MVGRASCALLVALVAVCSVQTGAPPPGTSAVSSAPVHPPAHLQNQHRGHPGCWRRSKRWFDSAHGGMIHAIPYPAVGVHSKLGASTLRKERRVFSSRATRLSRR